MNSFIDKKNVLINYILILFISIIFLYSGVLKLLNVQNFFSDLENYTLIPKFFNRYLVFAVIFTEMWIGMGIIFKKTRRVSSIIGILLLFLFTIFLFYEYILGNTNSCGCYSPFLENKISFAHVLQNIFIILLIYFLNEDDFPKISKIIQYKIRFFNK